MLLIQQTFIDTAPSMRSRVYKTAKRPSVRPSVGPSVCPIDRTQQSCEAALLMTTRRAGDIDRLLHGGAGAQQQRRRSTALSSKCGAVSC